MPEARIAVIDAFLARNGWADAVRRPLAGDASARRYFRLTQGAERAVLMDADPARGERVDHFLAVGGWLLERGYSAPEILGADPAHGLLLLEDLGDGLFARLVAQDAGLEMPLYLLATAFLSDLHRHAPPAFVSLADGAVLGDLVALLGEFYLPATGGSVAGAAELSRLVRELYLHLNDGPAVLSLRDFHAENLLWLPERDGVRRAGVLDFQDAFAVHPAYDLVSLLQDARRDVSPDVEAACVADYLRQRPQEFGRFSAIYALLGAQRALRILAVFARLAIRDGKPRYLALAPRVWANLQRNLAHTELAALAAAVRDILPEPTPARLQRMTG